MSIRPNAAIIVEPESILAGAAGIIRNALRRWRAANNARRTMSALSVLSDHQLRDIGLRREDIPGVAERCSQADRW